MEEKETQYKKRHGKVRGRVLCTKSITNRLTKGKSYPVVGTRNKGRGLEFKIIDDKDSLYIFGYKNCPFAEFEMINFDHVLCTKSFTDRLTESNKYPIVNVKNKEAGLEFTVIDDNDELFAFILGNCALAQFELINFKVG